MNVSEWEDLTQLAQGFIEAMFFTYDIDANFIDLAPETVGDVAKICADFERDNQAEIYKLVNDPLDYDFISVGRDLWFTMNGSGVGFWDRCFVSQAAIEAAERLTRECGLIGMLSAYQGDNGKIYLGG